MSSGPRPAIAAGADAGGRVRRLPGTTRLYALLTLATGVVAAMAAASAVGAPAVATAHETPPPALAAGDLYPSVPPTHMVVDVYDPAPPAIAWSAPVAAPRPQPVQQAPAPPAREPEHEGEDHPGGDD